MPRPGKWRVFSREMAPDVIKIDYDLRAVVVRSAASEELRREAWETLMASDQLGPGWCEVFQAADDDVRLAAQKALLDDVFSRLGGPGKWPFHRARIAAELRRGVPWTDAIEPFAGTLGVRPSFAWELARHWCERAPRKEEHVGSGRGDDDDPAVLDLMSRCRAAPSGLDQYEYVVAPWPLRRPSGEWGLRQLAFRERGPEEEGPSAEDVSEPAWR